MPNKSLYQHLDINIPLHDDAATSTRGSHDLLALETLHITREKIKEKFSQCKDHNASKDSGDSASGVREAVQQEVYKRWDIISILRAKWRKYIEAKQQNLALYVLSTPATRVIYDCYQDTIISGNEYRYDETFKAVLRDYITNIDMKLLAEIYDGTSKLPLDMKQKKLKEIADRVMVAYVLINHLGIDINKRKGRDNKTYLQRFEEEVLRTTSKEEYKTKKAELEKGHNAATNLDDLKKIIRFEALKYAAIQEATPKSRPNAEQEEQVNNEKFNNFVSSRLRTKAIKDTLRSTLYYIGSLMFFSLLGAASIISYPALAPTFVVVAGALVVSISACVKIGLGLCVGIFSINALLAWRSKKNLVKDVVPLFTTKFNVEQCKCDIGDPSATTAIFARLKDSSSMHNSTQPVSAQTDITTQIILKNRRSPVPVIIDRPVQPNNSPAATPEAQAESFSVVRRKTSPPSFQPSPPSKTGT